MDDEVVDGRRSYWLVPEDGGGRWLLEWDAAVFLVRSPSGEVALEAPVAQAHWAIDLISLYSQGCPSFVGGTPSFKADAKVAAFLKGIVEAGLRWDGEFRQAQRAVARRALWIGGVMFIIGGGLFGAYCWWAIGNDWPPEGHPMRGVLETWGWVIKVVLFVLIGLGGGGLVVAWSGLRQAMRIRSAERAAGGMPGAR